MKLSIFKSRSTPIARCYCYYVASPRHFTKIFGFSNGNDLCNILWLALELEMCSEVFLVLIKLRGGSYCRVKFSKLQIVLFFGMG